MTFVKSPNLVVGTSKGYQEREDADLDIHGEIVERNGTTRSVGAAARLWRLLQ
jgi:hypothetical protein